MTAFKVTSRVVVIAFPKGAPNITGTNERTISPSYARVINPGLPDGRVEVTGWKHRDDGTVTKGIVYTTTVALSDVPEWLDAVLDLALLGENE